MSMFIRYEYDPFKILVIASTKMFYAFVDGGIGISIGIGCKRMYITFLIELYAS